MLGIRRPRCFLHVAVQSTHTPPDLSHREAVATFSGNDNELVPAQTSEVPNSRERTCNE